MGRFCVFVIGPAGSGKSTLCHLLQQQVDLSRRRCHIVNLDPAAEYMPYSPSADVRTLVDANDVAECCSLGPNGALVKSMQFLAENTDWLEEVVESFPEDELILFDLPGQLELYVHLDALREVARVLERSCSLCCLHCLDIGFFTDSSKLLSGALVALNAMLHFSLPHINVLTKCDLVEKQNFVTLNKGRRGAVRRRQVSAREDSSDSSSEEGEDELPSSLGQGSLSRPLAASRSSRREWGGRPLGFTPFGLGDFTDVSDETSYVQRVIDALLERDPEQLVEELDVRFRSFFSARFFSLLTRPNNNLCWQYVPVSSGRHPSRLQGSECSVRFPSVRIFPCVVFASRPSQRRRLDAFGCAGEKHSSDRRMRRASWRGRRGLRRPCLSVDERPFLL